MKSFSLSPYQNGGCTAKLSPDALSYLFKRMPTFPPDPNLLVGYESNDDAAIYLLREDLALVQTVDFSPPMVDDPYLFGQIAAANAVSAVFAMGGTVKTALNLVCFPENLDLDLLSAILAGGAEKLREAGGILAGGHSIRDTGVKYGLAVNGVVDPRRVYRNDGGQPGDQLILTKRLGVGIISAADRAGQASKQAMEEAVASMTTLNRGGADILSRFTVHACTDVTGFGFLGHLHEMMAPRRLSCVIDSLSIPRFDIALSYAADYCITAAAQRNRKALSPFVTFHKVPFPMEELLFDPQTSGGLLAALPGQEAREAVRALRESGLPAAVVGDITDSTDQLIHVY